jgi:hypothetical protein
MIDLLLENNWLDIGKNEAALLTFSIDDITKFSSRSTTFSKTITLPGTARNNKAFGQVFEIGGNNPYNPTLRNLGTNFNVAAEAKAKLYSNQILTVKGTLKLLEVRETNGVFEYDISIFGELAGLVQALGANKLEDLDFSAYNHVWNATNIQASWNTIDGSSYYYPLIDYGECSVLKQDWDIRAFRPAFYAKEYFDKIFTAAGYSYESTHLDTAFFKRLIIPNNAKELYKVNNNLVTGTRGSTQVVIDNTLMTDSGYVQFTSTTLNNFTYDISGQFTYTGANPITVTVSIRVTGIYNSVGTDIDIFCAVVGGAAIGNTILPASGGDTSFDETFTNTVSLVNGNVIRCEAIVVDNTQQWHLEVDSNTTINITSAQAVQGTANPGDTLEVNQTLPKGVFQIDLLASLCKLNNLMIDDDRDNNKKINITPWPDYYPEDSADCVDWSDKLDRSRPKRIKPMSELNARIFEFKYKQDSDYYNDSYRKLYNEGYGDRYYDSGYEFAKAKETCEIIFAGSPLLGYSGEDKYVTTCFKARSTGGAIDEERTETVIRILQAKKITGVTAWDLLDGVSTLAAGLTAYGYAGHLDDPTTPTVDLNFGAPRELYFELDNAYPSANMFNTYWSGYMAEITDKDSKLLEAWFKLDASDITNLDFSKYVFIDGHLFRLNKIEDWNASSPDVCKVTLIKVINTTYT